MWKIIIIYTISYILCNLMVSAKGRSSSDHYHNVWRISTESADSNSSDNVKINKTCNIILNFSNMGFTYIGPNFVNSIYVNNLTLSDNSITEFEEDAFAGLPNLEYLDSSKNKLSLTQLFSFGGHSNLKTLILDYNTDVNYNSTLRMSTNVYEIGVGYSTTKAPESVRRQLNINPSYNFPKLEYLSLRNVNIDSLSASWIFNFPKLKYLDLSENLFYEPAIYVYNNLPPTVFYLMMEKADLTAIRSQQFKNITKLNVNHNYFESISDRFCNDTVLCLQGLYNLQSLYASNCSISIIEIDSFKNTKLLELDISNNQINNLDKEVLENMPYLVHLDLSRNHLCKMPNFSVLKNLSSLKLDHMHLSSIFKTLSLFPFMPNLITISLQGNSLKIIPEKFLDNLPALREIDLSFNEITSLPTFMAQNLLSKLYLSFNRIFDIDKLSLKNATLLEILDLRSNPISGIKIGNLQKLPSNALLYL